MNFDGKTPEEIIYEFQKKLKFPTLKIFPILAIGIALLGIFLLANTVYTIQPNEVGVLLRLGKFVRNSGDSYHNYN